MTDGQQAVRAEEIWSFLYKKAWNHRLVQYNREGKFYIQYNETVETMESNGNKLVAWIGWRNPPCRKRQER